MNSGPEALNAVEWLTRAAPDAAECRKEWEREPAGVALLPAGRLWDVLVVGAALGYPALDVLTACLDRPGPVLADAGGPCRGTGRIGFFVPPGTAARWVGTGVRGLGRGTWIVVPHPGPGAVAGASAVAGTRWIVPPDGSGTLTDPALLELALHEAAARLADDGGQ